MVSNKKRSSDRGVLSALLRVASLSRYHMGIPRQQKKRDSRFVKIRTGINRRYITIIRCDISITTSDVKCSTIRGNANSPTHSFVTIARRDIVLFV